MTTTPTTTRTDAALGLMQTVLRDGRPMAAEYPLLFGSDATGQVELIETEGEVASTCAWLRRDLVVGGLELPIALVGSVAVTSSGSAWADCIRLLRCRIRRRRQHSRDTAVVAAVGAVSAGAAAAADAAAQ